MSRPTIFLPPTVPGGIWLLSCIRPSSVTIHICTRAYENNKESPPNCRIKNHSLNIGFTKGQMKLSNSTNGECTTCYVLRIVVSLWGAPKITSSIRRHLTLRTMIIPIAALSESAPQEWSLLELNGELMRPVNRSNEAGLDGTEGDACASYPHRRPRRMELGAVRFDAGGIPVMTVGSHELRGKIEVLKQPFVVLRKRKRRSEGAAGAGCGSPDSLSERHRGAKSNDADDTAGFSLEMAGVVSKKMLFDRYPKSIMR